MKYKWIESYDWLIDYLCKNFCTNCIDRNALLKWINCTNPQYVCRTIYDLFGEKYISEAIATTFKLKK